MPQQTIRIERHPIGRQRFFDEIDADVRGHFAVHETLPVESDLGWTVTHIPTGWLCLSGLSKRAAIGARNEFAESALDWSFTNHKAMTREHKRVGKAIKQRWGGK